MAGGGGQRRFISLVLTLALVSGVLASLDAGPVGAQPKPAPKNVPPLASEPAPPRRSAIPSGDPSNPPPLASLPRERPPAARFDPATSREDPAQTSATRKVYDNADGSKTALVSAGPARVPNARGGFDDIDLGLTAAPGARLRPRVGPQTSRVEERVYDAAGRVVASRWAPIPGAVPPTTSGGG